MFVVIATVVSLLPYMAAAVFVVVALDVVVVATVVDIVADVVASHQAQITKPRSLKPKPEPQS